MTPQRYAEIKEAFATAAGLEPDARSAFLDELARRDPDLRSEVEQLLAHDLTGDLPIRDVPAAADLLDRNSSAEARLPHDLHQAPRTLPERIGPYRIVREIGAGGMGVVYEAEQDNPRRAVALKMIRPGLISAALLRRFEFEAQVLARLQHPGIAQVFQAGQTTLPSSHGSLVQPYFAMEFIRGRGLLEFVSDAYASRSARLELFARICDAVHHAHQNGVIHRDLKPGNIMVQDDGQPKILDFGVARAIDSDLQAVTLQTDVGQLVGTLPYMSPEQIAGDPRQLDTRSDVYALGVIGFELLTSRLPTDVRQRSIAEAIRVLRDSEPRRLGQVEPSLRGDLDLIFNKALAQDREQRYASAAELAADVRRYLADQPIMARPPSATYQLRKFARRHRGLVIGLAAAAVMLLAGTVISTWQAIRATRAESATRAALQAVRQAQAASEAAAAEASTVSAFLVTIFEHADPAATRDFDRGLLRVLLDEAAVRVDQEFADQPTIRATLHHVVGRVYMNLSALPEAESHLDRARALRASLEDDPAESLAIQATVAELRNLQGRHDEAEQLHREVIAGRTDLLGPDAPETLAARYALAGTLYRQQRLDEAQAEHAATLARLRATQGEDAPAVTEALNGLGLLRSEAGDFAGAIELFEQVFERWTARYGPDAPATVTALTNLARAREQIGQFERAEAETRDLLARCEENFGPEHHDTLQARINLGVLLLGQHRYEEAYAELQTAVAASRQRFGPRNPVTYKAVTNLAIALRRLERFDEASETFAEAIALARHIYGSEHANTRRLLGNYAGLLYNLQRVEEAVEILREVVAADTATFGPDHVSTLRGRHNLALLLLDLEEYEEAAEILADVLVRTDTAAPPGHPFRFEVRRTYGDTLRRMERFDQAEPLLLAAHEGLLNAYGEGHVRPNETVRALVALYEAWGALEEADTWRERLNP